VRDRAESVLSAHSSVISVCAGTAGATQAGTATMTKGLYNLLVTKVYNTKRENYGCASHLYGGAAQ